MTRCRAMSRTRSSKKRTSPKRKGGSTMIGISKTGLGLGICAALLAAASAQAAGVTLNSARVGAADVAALEKFYEAAFGMQEVQRIGAQEVMLNFGDSVADAKAN